MFFATPHCSQNATPTHKPAFRGPISAYFVGKTRWICAFCRKFQHFRFQCPPASPPASQPPSDSQPPEGPRLIRSHAVRQTLRPPINESSAGRFRRTSISPERVEYAFFCVNTCIRGKALWCAPGCSQAPWGALEPSVVLWGAL